MKGKEDDKVDVSSLDFSKMDALALRLLWWWTSSWANEQYENRMRKSAGPNDDKTNGSANGEQDDDEEPSDATERGEAKTSKGKE